jgi:SHS2 domain-containing protein
VVEPLHPPHRSGQGKLAPADDQRVAGHRVVPHTADLIVEAWAPTKQRCLEEAVVALVESFAEPTGAASTHPVPVTLDAPNDEDLLVRLLEEVVYVVEVRGVVPLGAHFRVDGGRVAGHLEVVPVDQVELVGAVPKAVARHALSFVIDDGTWRCRAVIDV